MISLFFLCGAFDGVNGDALLINMEEIAVSNGAACSSNTKEPSYVLKALGIKDKLAEASLRICIGRFTTEEEIDYTVNKLKDVIQDLRGIEELKAELSNEKKSIKFKN